MYKVFSDFHHASLLQSLILLFEKRLGGEVYRPIGMEWYEQGYWAVYDHPATADQYLKVGGTTPDGTPRLNEVDAIDSRPHTPVIYYCKDINDRDWNKAITLEAFKEMKFDILIASLPQHIEPFKKLIAAYQPQAKLIYQIGNQWNVDSNSVKNVMASANVEIPKGVNGVIYHQEFDLDVFHYEEPKQDKKIYSFINCLNTVDIYKKDWELFLELEKLMPDYTFESWGGQCRQGAIHDSRELADKMREATFIFHCKTEGDGYGHVIHNSAAVGRPLITRAADYKRKLAEKLIDQYTSILVDDKTPEQIAQAISRKTSEEIEAMGRLEHAIFNRVCDFDAEETEIRKFLENLQ